MAKLLKAFLFLLLVLVIGCKDVSNKNESAINVVSAEEMKALIEMDDVQLVDVRTKEEYELEHLDKAQNIDVRSPDFDQQITKLDKNKPVLLYCKSGMRSAECAEKLKDAGFVKIYDLSGGITKWKYAGFPTKTKS